MTPFFVYILYSNYPKTYVGLTDNLQRRLDQHNRGKSKFTSKYSPWIILHYEECADRISARLLEKKYKSGSGRRLIAKMIEQRNIQENLL